MRFVYITPLKHLVLIGPDKGAVTMVWLAEGTRYRLAIRQVLREEEDREDKQAGLRRRTGQGLWEKSAGMVEPASAV